MKKALSLLLASAMVFSLVACGGSSSDTASTTAAAATEAAATEAAAQEEAPAEAASDETVIDDSTIQGKIALAQTLTTDELIEKAAEETGDFVAYGNSSRITTAMTNFIEKYGDALGLTENNALASKQTDSEIYTLISSEYATPTSASMVLIQDSATLSMYRENTDWLLNYIPYGMEEYVAEDALVPLVQQYTNKLFIYNNTGDDVPSFSNVWELTEDKYAGKIYFKSPEEEQVNMNFLIMLTNDEWSGKLKDAYVELYGEEADDVGTEYENYGYKWIAEFLRNCDFSYNSDTNMAAGVSSPDNAGKIGLFVLSKLRDESVTPENLDVAAWVGDGVTPFAGFMYALYAQVVNDCPRPYTAMLFINYIMTEEGFAPWMVSVGGYSSNNSVPVYEGDRTLDFWRDTLVIEDGDYIQGVKAELEDYILGILAE